MPRTPSVPVAWAGANVLVTGASGFIGGHLAKYLADRGANVFAVCSPGQLLETSSGNQYRWFDVELRDAVAVQSLVQSVQPVAVFHLGAVGGVKPPFWDQHDEFGDTNMLVVKPQEGASLARALGAHWLVLMNRHGVTVVGTSVKDCVFRSVYSARNAEYQVRAMAIGDRVASLSPGETALAGKITAMTTGLARSWEYWSLRVAKAGGALPAPKAARAKSSVSAESQSKPKPRKKRVARRR